MQPKFEHLNCMEDDVILLENCTSMIGDLNKALEIQYPSNFNPFSGRGFSIDELRQKIIDRIIKGHLLRDSSKAHEIFWENGKECQLLKVGGSSWVKGRIRLTLQVEFAPDESEIKESIVTDTQESPLDDLRRTINHMS